VCVSADGCAAEITRNNYIDRLHVDLWRVDSVCKYFK